MEKTARLVREQGQILGVRSRRWVVRQVTLSSLPALTPKPVRAGPQTPRALLLAEDNDAGEELQVMRAFEPGAPSIPGAALQALARLGSPDHLGEVPYTRTAFACHSDRQPTSVK